MKNIFRENIYFFFPALVFLVLNGIYILTFGKEQSFLFINHTRSELLDNLMPYVTFMGDGWFAGILVVLFSAFPLYKQSKLLVAWLFTFLLVTILKNYIFPEALRPISHFYEQNHLVWHPAGITLHTSHSFPSGHTASAFAVFTILSSFTDSRMIKILCLVAAILAGWSRVYLGQHFTEDIWIGATIGIALSAAVLYILRDFKKQASGVQWLLAQLKKMM